MGIEDATDWNTAFKGVPADPALAGRRRRISRLDAPVARELSRPTTTEDACGGGCMTGEKGHAPPTRGDD